MSVKVIRASEAFKGKQGLAYTPGVSAETVGARAINLQLVTLPPGARAYEAFYDDPAEVWPEESRRRFMRAR